MINGLIGPHDDLEDSVSTAEVELDTADSDTIKQITNNLDNSYTVIRDLGDVIRSQENQIQNLKQRLKDHGVHVLEKSIVETTREELEKINKSIPAVRTRKAGVRQPGPTLNEQVQFFAERSYENQDAFASMVQNLVKGVDLEKHGIDPVTFMFKPGYGPNGKIPEPVVAPKKKTLLDRILNAVGLYRV